MSYRSDVLVFGAVASVDVEKRDITVISKTPKGKDVAIICHMWKTQGIDDDNPEHAGRGNWRDIIEVGQNLAIQGHMGNNGRVIVRNFAPIDEVAAPMSFERATA